MSQKLYFGPGEFISYNFSQGSLPGVIFLPGLMSSMNGTKALALEEFCVKTGRAYTRFDHRGLGESSGKPVDCTVSSRKEDVLRLMEEIKGTSPQVLIGSSLGGWIMLHVAMEMPERIQGLIGIATAADFVSRRFDNLPLETKTEIQNIGYWTIPSQFSQKPYILTWDMIQDARKHVLQGRIPISCPVRLIHGMKDQEVPYKVSLDVSDRLLSNNVQLTLLKNGGHRLSEPNNLKVIIRTLTELLDELTENKASKL
ncbi:predicted protein [Nematostella vectensis]|uniref:Palmitoyl-protein thioesterase ABHD10, mitochondrial n=1 Tax=Nematostella vectensis TaxID=45351 RepID=A7RVD5_NEMVE|nr:predicted protein [Nematostella vectensis]|eukprot:XP_001636686.1 predicted protein [Nematostella vectensis]